MFLKTTHLKTWPKYLLVHVVRELLINWVPMKSNALIDFDYNKVTSFE